MPGSQHNIINWMLLLCRSPPTSPNPLYRMTEMENDARSLLLENSHREHITAVCLQSRVTFNSHLSVVFQWARRAVIGSIKKQWPFSWNNVIQRHQDQKFWHTEPEGWIWTWFGTQSDFCYRWCLKRKKKKPSHNYKPDMYVYIYIYTAYIPLKFKQTMISEHILPHTNIFFYLTFFFLPQKNACCL